MQALKPYIISDSLPGSVFTRQEAAALLRSSPNQISRALRSGSPVRGFYFRRQGELPPVKLAGRIEPYARCKPPRLVAVRRNRLSWHFAINGEEVSFTGRIADKRAINPGRATAARDAISCILARLDTQDADTLRDALQCEVQLPQNLIERARAVAEQIGITP